MHRDYLSIRLHVRFIVAITVGALAVVAAHVVTLPAPKPPSPPAIAGSPTAELPVVPSVPPSPALEVVAKATWDTVTGASRERHGSLYGQDVMATVVAVGQPWPLTYTIVNRSARAQTVLPSLDASDVSWRYPKISIEIRDIHGHLIETDSFHETRFGHGRCSRVNHLRSADFVTLAPGESLELFGEERLRRLTPSVPGVYALRLRYDLSFAGADRAVHDGDVDELIATLPRGIYESEPLWIEVTGF